MNPRLRRALAALATLAFLTGWIWAAVSIAAHLPDSRLLELVFYVVAGTCWGLPLIPLLKWAESGGEG